MSWSTLSLISPTPSLVELTKSLTVFSVCPWSYSNKEGGGMHTWLSFPNAVEAISEQLDESMAMMAIAIAAANMSDFASQASALNNIFPYKELEQWQRHALSLVTLESDKFDLVESTIHHKIISTNAIQYVNEQTKYALTEQAISDAVSLADADPLTNLNAFLAQKPSLTEPDINTGSAGYYCYAETDIKNSLQINQLAHSYTLTGIIVFAGTVDDLAPLKNRVA